MVSPALSAHHGQAALGSLLFGRPGLPPAPPSPRMVLASGDTPPLRSGGPRPWRRRRAATFSGVGPGLASVATRADGRHAQHARPGLHSVALACAAPSRPRSHRAAGRSDRPLAEGSPPRPGGAQSVGAGRPLLPGDGVAPRYLSPSRGALQSDRRRLILNALALPRPLACRTAGQEGGSRQPRSCLWVPPSPR